MLIKQFILSILFIFLKLILYYLVLSVALNLWFYWTSRNLEFLFSFSLNKRKKGIYLFAAVLSIYLIKFLHILILYPQLFTDSFYLKNAGFAFFQSSLTNNLSPVIFSSLLSIIFLTTAAVIAAGILRRHRAKFSFKELKKKLIFAGALILVSISFSSLFTHYNTNPESPHVLILASDALRPDHFSANGYSKNTTPNIDRFINDNRQFTNIYTAVPRTFPAWVSMLTSRYPMYHNIKHMFPSSKVRNQNFVTLASELKKYGYTTAVVGDFAADIFPRIELGYDHIKAPSFNLNILLEQIIIKNHILLIPFITNSIGKFIFPGVREFAEYADPEIVSDDLCGLIDTMSSSQKPFFITSFYSVTHFPFSSPWPYYNTYTDPHYNGPYKYQKNRIVSTGKSKSSQIISETDKKHIRALYDGCLHAFDHEVGKIISHLKKRGLYRNTIIVIMSDHGENLYEYNFAMGHGEHLRGPYSLKIPCIIKAPGNKKDASDGKISSIIDIAPTIMELTEHETPKEFQGKSLLGKKTGLPVYLETGLWFDNAGDFFFQKQRILYPDITGLSVIEFDYHKEIHLDDGWENLTYISKHRAIVTDRYKLIYMPTEKGIKYELYDIKKDPYEQNDICNSNHAALKKMKKIFWDFIKKDTGSIIKNEYIIPVFQDPLF